MNKLIAFLGASAVGLGALGAHTLAGYLDQSSLESFKTAVFITFCILLLYWPYEIIRTVH